MPKPDAGEALARFEREGVFAIPRSGMSSRFITNPCRSGDRHAARIGRLATNFRVFSTMKWSFGAGSGRRAGCTLRRRATMIFRLFDFNDIMARDTGARDGLRAGAGQRARISRPGNIHRPCIVSADSLWTYRRH